MPAEEDRRLAALRRYDVLDTAPEQAFDDLTALASELCGTPIALVSLVDADRQWFKSRVGLDAPQTPRNLAFCGYAILDDDLLVVPDATADPRFAANPLVTGEPNVRFYAGAPLVTNDGMRLGTLCVIDQVPRELDQAQLHALRVLGRQVITQLELRSTIDRLQRSTTELRGERQQLEDTLRRVLDDKQQDRAHRSFLSHVSHELRTPLNAVIGMSEVLVMDAEDEGPAGEARLGDLKLIHDAGNHMLELVNGLLELAVLDGDAVSLDIGSVNIRECVESVIAMSRPLAQRGGNRLVVEFGDAVPHVSTDGTKLRQVLLNLVGNASKFTQDGTITVRVASVDGAARVRFEIIDTGVGMTEEQLARLYERFTRFTSDHVRPTQGTGLGMTITKGLCDRLGATIEVRSTPGEGTTFIVEVPTGREAENPSMPS